LAEYFCHNKAASFVWYPTDPDLASLASQRAYVEEIAAASVLPAGCVVAEPASLTLTSEGILEEQQGDGSQQQPQLFPMDDTVDLVVNINMVHISPWPDTSEGLMKTCGRKLRANGFLLMYGPFKENGTCVESNK